MHWHKTSVQIFNVINIENVHFSEEKCTICFNGLWIIRLKTVCSSFN